jgi:sigma-B regulation protein RsbU (phosphoserine phosphatase)
VDLEAELADQLRRLEAIADPDLAEFRPKDLLQELLDRVQDVMAVDTVAILVVDRGGSHVVARAARGLEQEVRQGFRVRIGHGFAGRVAATRSPVAIEDVGPGTVVNPLLWRTGIRSLLGVPLIADGRLVGVMHVGSLRPRVFSEDDTNVLQVAANRIATTLVSEQAAADRTAARTLQESLQPTELPDVAGLEFATRFIAAMEFGVGGDWYDAFVLPDGRIGIVIGDVAGNGLPAAVVMGRLRSSLRSYAIESARPGEALDRLRREFSHFEPTEMATVMYLTIPPDLDRFIVASTGHLPPVLTEPGREPVLLDCSPSPPLGVDDPTPHVDTTRPLAPGTTVVLYTDGLIERRTAPIDEGLELLRSSCRLGSADEICHAIVDTLVGEAGVDDDTALLVFRRATPDAAVS